WGTAVASLRASGWQVNGIACDVTDPVSVQRAAKATCDAFGNVHVVCNNAGVAGGSGIDDISLETWRWGLDGNVLGVLPGIRTFLPPLPPHAPAGPIAH